MLLNQLRGFSSRRAPPPPPPPKKKNINNIHVNHTSKPSVNNPSLNNPTASKLIGSKPKVSNSGGGLWIVGAVVVVGCGWYIYSTGINAGNYKTPSKKPTYVADLPTGSTSQFLKELASKGDTDAKAVVETKAAGHVDDVFNPDDFKADFRLDPSRDGLNETLNMMLNAKRKEEKMEIARIRNISVHFRHEYLEEGLKQLKAEKAELKKHIKALSKHKL